MVFAIDHLTGRLHPLQWASTQGETPRFFTLDPTGDFLYALNQDSDTLVIFMVDQATGILTPTGQIIQSGSPVCLAFIQWLARYLVSWG